MNKSEFYLKYRFIIWPAIVGISTILILALVIIPQLLTYLKVRDQIIQTQNKRSQARALSGSQYELSGNYRQNCRHNPGFYRQRI